MSTTTVVFVRHGQTDWNVERRWQGQENIPLNATGRLQAAAVARRLARWPLAALYSSDLSRAADTAAAIGAQLALPVQFDPVWRERHGGIFQGLTVAEREVRFPIEAARFAENLALAPPDGEGIAPLRMRAVAGLEALLARHGGETVGVVSHGGTIMAIVSHVLGLPDTVRPRCYAAWQHRPHRR